jgi:hypothetical protein
MTETTTRPRRAWTIDNDDTIVPLALGPDCVVYFETGAGVIEAYIDDAGLVVCSGEFPFRIGLTPVSDNEINVTVDGWQDEPQPGEVCQNCGAPAIVVYVWKPNGRRVAWCVGPGGDCLGVPEISLAKAEESVGL